MPPNNRMQRSGTHKLHAPDRQYKLSASSYALQAQRAVADAGRWATLTYRGCWLFGLSLDLWHP
jgi:hypothetical protein